MSEQPVKNDGSDSKKYDPSSADEHTEATSRTCYLQVVNNTSTTLTRIALTHTSGNNNETLNVPSLEAGGTSPSKQIHYETGWGASFDYWNISFNVGSVTWNTPWNDRCNISYEDAGKTISCKITRKDDGDYNLEVAMPESSGCNFVIQR